MRRLLGSEYSVTLWVAGTCVPNAFGLSNHEHIYRDQQRCWSSGPHHFLLSLLQRLHKKHASPFDWAPCNCAPVPTSTRFENVCPINKTNIVWAEKNCRLTPKSSTVGGNARQLRVHTFTNPSRASSSIILPVSTTISFLLTIDGYLDVSSAKISTCRE